VATQVLWKIKPFIHHLSMFVKYNQYQEQRSNIAEIIVLLAYYSIQLLDRCIYVHYSFSLSVALHQWNHMIFRHSALLSQTLILWLLHAIAKTPDSFGQFIDSLVPTASHGCQTITHARLTRAWISLLPYQMT
jgi:hypothetical protein